VAQLERVLGQRPDGQCQVSLDVQGADFDELLSIHGPWGLALRDASAYPAQGPHDLAPIR
jgi:hypothetical protein